MRTAASSKLVLVPCLLGLMGLLAGSAPVHAQPRPADPLALVQSSDPLELARVVDRLGDPAVLARLGTAESPIDVAVTLAAVRACPWLHAPELALPRLVELAAGRDPDLAPAATLAVVRIAERLSRPELESREASDEPLRAAMTGLTALAEDTTARADLRRGASRARELLRAIVEGS